MVIIDGQIGVGKTTLAEKIKAALQIPIFYELSTPVTQTILDKFYKDQARWSFTSQVHFLINRFQMIKSIEHTATGILDRSMYGDSIFAEVLYEEGFMDEEEYFVYKSLLENFLNHIKPPQLMIYLDCNIDNAVKRIKVRSRECEHDISQQYLEKINNKYLAWYGDYAISPKLFINTDNLNIHKQADEKHIIKLIQEQLKDLI